MNYTESSSFSIRELDISHTLQLELLPKRAVSQKRGKDKNQVYVFYVKL